MTHRPQTEPHSYEYENNTHKSEQALPAWRGAGRTSRDTNPPPSSSDGACICRIRLRFSAADLRKLLERKKKVAITLLLLQKFHENTMISSTEKQSSSAITVHKPKRTAMNARTIYARQNKPHRLGSAPAGVEGTRSRRCPAATVPADVVFACGFLLLFC